MPGAVLRSRTTRDIAAMIRLRREHDIPVAVLAAAGLRFAAGLTGYVPLTIGGRLSAGGIGGNFATGARVDHIRRIEVVTGGGEIVPASERDNRDLFDAALGGLGQGGVITCAELEVEPLPTAVHSWVLPVTDASAAFDLLRAPIGGSGVDEVHCMPLPPGPCPAERPSRGRPSGARGAHGESTAPRDAPARCRTVGYLEHVLTSSAVIDRWRQAAGTSVANCHRHAAADEPGGLVRPAPEGFVLLSPPHRRLPPPRLRLPEQPPGSLVWLFDVLNTTGRAPEPGSAEAMPARDRSWIAAAHRVGGTVYPVGGHESTPGRRLLT